MDFGDSYGRERAIAGGLLIEIGRVGPGSVAFSRRLFDRVDDPETMRWIVEKGLWSFADYGGGVTPFEWRSCHIVHRRGGGRDRVEVRTLFEASPDGGIAVTYLEEGEPCELAVPLGDAACVM